MKQEYKELLLKDICARLPYGVKILHTGWDYDSDTDFDTVETLIGIDDKFIYTVWDKTGDREKHCLSVSNWKPYLRPMSSMTEEERYELRSIFNQDIDFDEIGIRILNRDCNSLSYLELQAIVNFFYAHHLDWCELIPKKLALEAPEGMYK